MKYVLARTSHSAGLHYHCFGNMILSSTLIPGTPRLSEAYVYESQKEAEEILYDDMRLQYSSYFVATIEDRELFEARLKGT
jgi:hypothetical protein